MPPIYTWEEIHGDYYHAALNLFFFEFISGL